MQQTDLYTLQVIATIHNAFPTKFGLPRQSGLVETLESEIIFTPEYRLPAAFRGLDGYSHLWLIWGFSQAQRPQWSPTVRPPRLGGNTRMGVFATRSPYRPNPIGLSCVKLLAIDDTPAQGPVLKIAGADLMDGTPIFDIKPYLPYADCKPSAIGGFASTRPDTALQVIFPDNLRAMLPESQLPTLISVLQSDPRPAYQNDPARVYGFNYAKFDIRFIVKDDVLTVCEVVPI